MGNQGFNATAKGSRHSQKVDCLQDAGLAAAITAKKYVYATQILQGNILQVTHILDLEAGEGGPGGVHG